MMDTIIDQPTAKRAWHEIWWDVWRHPSIAAFQRALQEPGANALRGFMWMAVMAIIGSVFTTLITTIRLQRISLGGILGFFISIAIDLVIQPIFSVVLLAITSGLFHLVAKLLRGKGTWGQMIFCLSAIQSPVQIIAPFITILYRSLRGFLLPNVGSAFDAPSGIISLCMSLLYIALLIYMLALIVSAIQAVENISSGRTLVTVFAPWIAAIILGCCGLSLLIPAISRNTTESRSSPVANPGLVATGIFNSEVAGGGWDIAYTGLPTRTIVNDLAIDPSTPATLYAGTISGAFKSTNGGLSWSEINNGLTVNQVNTLAVDPLTPATIYAGTGDGVFKSTDRGLSWSPTGLHGVNITSLAIDPKTLSTVYAGRGGMPGGIFKSTDGGESWQPVNTGLGTYSVISDIAIDLQTPTALYTGSGGMPGGVFKSTDGGASWQAAGTDLTNAHVTALAIDPLTPGLLYAGTNNGVFKSIDRGKTWQAVNAGLTDLNVSSLAIDPANPATLYAGTDNGGVFKSTDGGGSWSSIKIYLTSNKVTALAIDTATPSALYAGTDGNGVYKYNK
jgi:photosystem II stability/assembly factor-like uncharacterized protein